MEKIFNNYSKDNRSENNKNKKRENAIKSINEVEMFLRNFKNMSKYIKLYKIIK